MTLTGTGIAALVWTLMVISIVPGPSDVAVAARSASNGFLQALFMVVGIAAADILFIVIAIYGLTAIVGLLPGLAASGQIIAGLMLMGFGIQLLLTVKTGIPSPSSGFSTSVSSFVSGFIITLADPKAIVFYMSLLPVFVDLSMATLIDVLVVMGCATAVIVLVKLSYAWLAGRAVNVFISARKPLHIVAGSTLMAIGLSLLLQY